ncbi:tyrosine-type recombinase/integrase [Phenylobacterium terrae]|uniref:Tyrosine-type recombinase/integrase n=1 Tax=Phenylobacterium terrae TaxID=2665495 RepID=A0ABW4N5K6_9CAUL
MPKVRLNDKSVRRPLPQTGQIELWDDLLPGFGLRLAAGGARTYFVMKRLDGKLVRRTVGKAPPFELTRDSPLRPNEFWPHEARERARHMLSDLSRGIDPVETKAAAPELSGAVPDTFGAVAKAYLNDPAKRGGAKLKSRAELERKVTKDLAAWKDRPISEITKTEIKALISAKRASSPVSANRLLALVKRIFGWAAREDIIAANPAANIEPTDETPRDRVLSRDELARVWAGAEAMGYPFGPLIKLLILTGQRRSEVAGLRWSEIDGKEWRLPDARTKRGLGHLVPLSPLALSVLKDCPRIGSSPLVFTTGKRKVTAEERAAGVKAEAAPVSGWSRMKDRLDLIIARAAAAEADEPLDMARHALPEWTLHDLRRTVATQLRTLGVDRLTVSKILNHAEGGMTRIYDRYSSDPEKRAALDRWSDTLEQLCGLNVIPMAGRA